MNDNSDILNLALDLNHDNFENYFTDSDMKFEISVSIY